MRDSDERGSLRNIDDCVERVEEVLKHASLNNQFLWTFVLGVSVVGDLDEVGRQVDYAVVQSLLTRRTASALQA